MPSRRLLTGRGSASLQALRRRLFERLNREWQSRQNCMCVPRFLQPCGSCTSFNIQQQLLTSLAFADGASAFALLNRVALRRVGLRHSALPGVCHRWGTKFPGKHSGASPCGETVAPHSILRAPRNGLAKSEPWHRVVQNPATLLHVLASLPHVCRDRFILAFFV